MDKIPVTIPGKLLPPEGDPAGKLMLFQGQVRSYNKVVDGAGRLMVTLFVQSMYETSENETLNKVSLTGALCKPPIYRSTPFGREICDMMLAVNAPFGKSDYIPCIAWGRNAQYAARFHVGDQLRLTGRLQSREYQKLLENGEYLTRNAYEVSAFTLDAPDAAPDFFHPSGGRAPGIRAPARANGGKGRGRRVSRAHLQLTVPANRSKIIAIVHTGRKLSCHCQRLTVKKRCCSPATATWAVSGSRAPF